MLNFGKGKTLLNLSRNERRASHHSSYLTCQTRLAHKITNDFSISLHDIQLSGLLKLKKYTDDATRLFVMLGLVRTYVTLHS